MEILRVKYSPLWVNPSFYMYYLTKNTDTVLSSELLLIDCTKYSATCIKNLALVLTVSNPLTSASGAFSEMLPTKTVVFGLLGSAACCGVALLPCE